MGFFLEVFTCTPKSFYHFIRCPDDGLGVAPRLPPATLAHTSKPQCFVAISKHASIAAHKGHSGNYASSFSKRVDAMAYEYSLSDVIERMYQNQLGLEATLMELRFMLNSKVGSMSATTSGEALWAIAGLMAIQARACQA